MIVFLIAQYCKSKGPTLHRSCSTLRLRQNGLKWRQCQSHHAYCDCHRKRQPTLNKNSESKKTANARKGICFIREEKRKVEIIKQQQTQQKQQNY